MTDVTRILNAIEQGDARGADVDKNEAHSVLPQIALREIGSNFEDEGMHLDFELLAAPGLTAGEIVKISP
jgi:hypothetical protein